MFDTNNIQRKDLLSTLWIFILFNVIFRDIHEFFRQGFLEEIMTDMAITNEFMLIAGILLEIPIVMVVLSRVLKRSVNRWANMVAGVLSILSMLANGFNDLDDIWFIGVAILGLLTIIGTAWTWREEGK